jgi:competence protein ComEC
MQSVWPKRNAHFWEEAPFFRLLLPLIVGIVVYDQTGPQGYSTGALFLWIGVAIAALFGVTLIRSRTKLAVTIRAISFCLLFGLLGYVVSALADKRSDPSLLCGPMQNSGATMVRVTDLPKEGERVWTVKGATLMAIDSVRSRKVAGDVLLYVYKGDVPLHIMLGDTILVSSNWQTINNTKNPFGFDYKQFCSRNNIFHQQVLPSNQILLVGHASEKELPITHRIQRKAVAILRRYVKDRETLGLLEAMLLGYEQDFDPELRQTYSDTGVVHVVAISGSHVATLFFLFSWIPFVVPGKKGKWIQYGLGLAAVWLYVLVAGAPPSAIRSAVMFSFLAAGILFDRQQHTMNTLLASVFAILCFRPMWLYSVGFQLSVAAVVSIILFYPKVKSWVTPSNKVVRRLWDLIAVSLAVQILVAPLVIYYFHNFPLWFLPANIAAWLLAGVLGLVGGFLIIACSWWPALASGIAWVVIQIVKEFDWLVRVFQDYNPAAFGVLRLDIAELILTYAFIMGTAGFFMKKMKAGFWTGAASLLFLLMLVNRDKWQSLHQDRFIVYAINRHTVAERIKGHNLLPVFSDTESAGFKAVKEARIGFGAPEPVLVQNSIAHNIKGQRLLVLDERGGRYKAGSHFPVDVLLVARPLKGLVAKHLIETFSPKTIVVGGSEKLWRVKAWADSCRKYKQGYHATRIHGAFVLE